MDCVKLRGDCSAQMADGLLGLERTDNNLELSTWPQVNMINQKNYYTSVPSIRLLYPEAAIIIYSSEQWLRLTLSPIGSISNGMINTLPIDRKTKMRAIAWCNKPGIRIVP